MNKKLWVSSCLTAHNPSVNLNMRVAPSSLKQRSNLATKRLLLDKIMCLSAFIYLTLIRHKKETRKRGPERRTKRKQSHVLPSLSVHHHLNFHRLVTLVRVPIFLTATGYWQQSHLWGPTRQFKNHLKGISNSNTFEWLVVLTNTTRWQIPTLSWCNYSTSMMALIASSSSLTWAYSPSNLVRYQSQAP